MAPSSWMRSILSPVKRWFAGQHMEALSRRLGDFGFASGGLPLVREVEEQEINSSLKEIYLQEEDDMKSGSLPSLREVEEILGYSFKNQDLLEEAFTHASYNMNRSSYERLEYVGDTVLNLLITKEQYLLYPNLPPGLLTSLRAANVDKEKLARVAVEHKLHKFLQHRLPMLSRQIRVFTGVLPHYPLHSYGLIDAPKILADIVESTIGAVFIDSNSSIDTTWEVAKGLLRPMITPEMLQAHPIRKLYETCQKNGMRIQLVDLWSKEGTYKVIVDNHISGSGKCRDKKEIALNRAANDAFNRIASKLSGKRRCLRSQSEQSCKGRR